jgi:hypothetical protein
MSISREDAHRIAEWYLEDRGLGEKVRCVVVLDEISWPWPEPLNWDAPHPDLYRSWIVYLEDPNRDRSLIKSSTILVISRRNGQVWIGSAGDEG